MADAPEVYHSIPNNQQGVYAPNTGPHYAGPHPEAEGLQVNTAYAEQYNKAPYTDNPHFVQYAENQPGGFIQPSPHPEGQYLQPVEKPERKRRICGLSVVVFWCLIVALILVIVGAVVGGVVGSSKAKNSKQADTASQDQNGGGNNNGPSSSSPVSMMPTSTAPGPTTTPASSTTGSSPSATATPAFDVDTFYRLSNQFLGKDLSLDIRNSAGTNSRQLNMSTTGDFVGQYWQFNAVPGSVSTYWLACLYLGEEIRLTLDPSDRINPLMETADDTAQGQQWVLGSIPDGTWTIGNVLGGSGVYLSTYSDTHALFMDTANDSGEKWSIATIRKILPSDNYH